MPKEILLFSNCKPPIQLKFLFYPKSLFVLNDICFINKAIKSDKPAFLNAFKLKGMQNNSSAYRFPIINYKMKLL
jgi:hypothetical protein